MKCEEGDTRALLDEAGNLKGIRISAELQECIEWRGDTPDTNPWYECDTCDTYFLKEMVVGYFESNVGGYKPFTWCSDCVPDEHKTVANELKYL